MRTNSPLISRLMTARIHEAMNARIQRAADEGTVEESRPLDRELGPGGWAAESNVGVVLDLLLGDGARTGSPSPNAVVPDASARTTPHLNAIKVLGDGLAPASSPAAAPASAVQAQQDIGQPEVEGARRELAGMGRVVVRASGTELAGLARERLG